MFIGVIDVYKCNTWQTPEFIMCIIVCYKASFIVYILLINVNGCYQWVFLFHYQLVGDVAFAGKEIWR